MPTTCLSKKRLTWTEHGNLHLRFIRPWDNGTDGLLMTPFQLIARLAAIVPTTGAKCT